MKIRVCLLAGVLALALCACSTEEKQESSLEVPETEQNSSMEVLGTEQNSTSLAETDISNVVDQQTEIKEESPLEMPETEQDSTSLAGTESSLEKDAQTSTQQEVNEQPIYYGAWVIEDYSASGISAWSDQQLEERLGTVYEYTEKTFVSNKIVLEEPQYNETQESKAAFEVLWEGLFTFESLGITGDSITYVSVDNSYDVGSTFYVCGTDKLLIVSDGAFFTVTRAGEN